uniref:Uncharacterized protein n=1 Tax=Cajanus cajan TaxID=3821 RepID=A0A151SGK9_CAJCA|nr:hypothetical protein KK1_000088 [Cajanus cajan]
MMVQGAWQTRHNGLEGQRLVIPPLSGAGSVRCSVKPASRYALRFRSNETCAFVQVP